MIICPRCKGCMEWNRFICKGEVFEGLHCLVCGEILDPLILFHRIYPYEKTKEYSRREKRAENSDKKVLVSMEIRSKK